MPTIERSITPKVAEDGSIHYSSVMTPPDDSVAVCHMVPTRIIPVVFVPGVMGSNLETKKTPDQDPVPVWLLNGSRTAAPWMSKNAKKRKRFLDPNQTQVHIGGQIGTGTAQTAGELHRRGWGEVSYMSYGEWLVWLENALNDGHSADTDYGRKGLRAVMCETGIPGLDKLAHAEVALSYRYQFPVHAVGYNWLASNAVSAERLATRIDEITAWYRNRFRYQCDKVILVTHSMGGLVARYYTEVLGGRDKVLGVVHGVMPATGAAAVYRRMKAGTEGPSTGPTGIAAELKGLAASLALGPDAATMTAVLGNAPGPLQLLPSREYGMEWLRIRDGERLVTLPKSDPYSEIYTVRGAWWGLCDDQLLNPLDPAKQTIERDWITFADVISNDVQPFHDAISRKYHANTYAFYGEDEAHKAYGNVAWVQQVPALMRGGVPPMADLLALRGADDPASIGKSIKCMHDGKTTFSTFVLREADEHGDGTVPVRSGYAPASRVHFCVPFPGIEHESAFGPESTRRFTLGAITRIVQSVNGTSLAYES